MPQDALDFYATPGRFTTFDEVDNAVAAGVGGDINEVVRIVQGLLIYDVVSQPFYGVTLTPTQADAINERDTARLMAIARSIDDRPIHVERPPTQRVGARCHAFTRLTVALLRAAGIPARARCGFGAYFRPGWFEDHWVAEYWDITNARWQMVDAQLDETWREKINFSGNALAITPMEFVTAGHAWQAWRRGDLDARRCGLSGINEHGAHWIAGNLRLDLAALNKVEMLPWDVWGAGWEPGADPTDEQLHLFDSVAELTVDVDNRFADLRTCYETDDSLRMDGTVFSVLRGAIETV